MTGAKDLVARVMARVTIAACIYATLPPANAVAQNTTPAPPPADAASEAAGTAKPAFLPPADAPFLEFSSKWPTRAFRQVGAVQGVVVPWDVKVSRLMPRFTTIFDTTPNELDLADHRALDGEGRTELVLEGPHALVFREAGAEEARQKGFGRGPGRAAGPDASLVFRFVSGVESAAEEGGGKPRLLMQRTWFAYYDPIAKARRRENADAEDAPAAKGVVLIMPGLYGTPEPTFDALVRRLRESEWGVLRMLSQPSRFTQLAPIEIDPEHMERSAEEVANILGDRAAECGLAVEAAWQFLEAQRPELAALPKAIMGTSGGGMTLPTVVAREPNRYAACVIIGGAADFWLIARRSSYRHDASSIDITVKGFARPPAEDDPAFDWRRFDELYLSSSPFDSYHTAKAMQGKPVLLFHGQMDTAVPASLGDVLWERLGRPERWEYPTGHEGLIIELLPRDTSKIIEWLRQHGLGAAR